MDLRQQKRRATFILITFWVIVGLTSALLYDLEWFIQKVILFNGRLVNDLTSGQVSFTSLSGQEILIVFKDYGVDSTESFYQQLDSLISSDQDSNLVQYYDARINWAFKLEGLIFAGGGLFAAFVSGPLVILAVNKRKNYRLIVLPLVLIFALALMTLAPLASSLLLLIVVFTPIFAFGYGYRTALDPWATSVARKSNVKIAFVRGFYEVGAGVGSLFMTQIYFHFNFHAKNIAYASATPYYIVGASLVLLALVLAFLMPNNVFSESHVSHQLSERKIKEVEYSNVINQKLVWKDIVFKKSFLIGLLAFTLMIGTIQAFNSIWVNTVENLTKTAQAVKNVQHIGYQKIFSTLPRVLFAFVMLKIIGRFSLKKMLLLIAAFSSLSWLMIGTTVYLVKGLDPLVIDLLGGVAEACVATMTILLGYEFVSRLSTLNTRPTVFVIFNSVTYGIGGIIFVQINAFLSKTVVFGAEGFLVWLVMSIAVAVSLLIIAFFFREQDYLTRETDEHLFEKQSVKRGKI